MVADNTNTKENNRSEFLEVHDEAIVKPEDERPVRITKKFEEELPGDEAKHDDEGIDESIDMDGEGGPDLNLKAMV